jgi:hypothetical protein
MLISKKYTLWGLKSNRNPWEPQNGICSSWNFEKSCDLSIDQKFYAELKIVYFMSWNATGSHESPKTCNKNFIFNVKIFSFSSFYMELEIFFSIIEISMKYYFLFCYTYVKNYWSLNIKLIIQLNVISGSECQ